ncbi:lipid-A-disaccharide synthase N-terminal domain-containing protein [Membranicola marinus]|uniref:Lipid-A-disaccharide synthase N-terminal domain-containing protein n=1 Tax=Membranihabitans marinus TaxID=1227546 RepID=A0A953HPN0_9BACT|nr:lipid-A-disaccharide synthase N-terminal domain-containing protein [Membranihabitans marinus]MBY5958939.1 lipid-A-disaccharide synthase N-terminal domain-containing protein [Membranihabitans marinus]
MSTWVIYGIGFLAQLLFSSRLIVQWLLSERYRRVITPSIFWKLSLLASLLLFAYGYFRHDFAIMLGQSLTYFIYIRNLQLQGEWQKAPRVVRYILLLVPIIAVIVGYNHSTYDFSLLLDNESIPYWLLMLGIGSQILFTFRFIYQWIYSEKYKVSELPVGFWRLSAAGATLILIYAIFRRDPVLLVGHIAGLTIYVRNIVIWKNQKYEVS